MIYLIYNILFTLICILLSPYLLVWAIWGKHGISQRLGFLPTEWTNVLKKNQVIWIHAASVGEVKILPAIIPKLKEKFPQAIIALSVMTRTGKKEAQESLKEIDFIFYLPLDLPWTVKKAVKAINPSLLILTETELWPNLIRQARKHGSKVALINGRISNKSFPGYKRFRFISSKVLSFVDSFCMRSQIDAKRIMSLGVSRTRVNVVGNIKFDQIFLSEQERGDKEIVDILSSVRKGRIIVAGSTHPGEEEMVLRAFKKLTFSHSDVLLIIAPRHLNHLDELESTINQLDLSCMRRSRFGQDKPGTDFKVMILDTLGELNQVYGLADLAFVGGSLVPKGGHNLSEPARFSIPVLFGPYADNFQEMALMFKSSQGGIQVNDEAELYLRMDELLSDENRRKTLGQKAKDAISQQGGAAERTAEILSKVW